MTSVALSIDGSLMSTSEVKLAEDGIGGLVCLKFWEAGSQNKEFSLSTIVYEPHRWTCLFNPFLRNRKLMPGDRPGFSLSAQLARV